MLHQNKRSKASKSDDWWTPKEVFDDLCKMYRFKPKLDASATNKNSLCDWYIDRKTNALVTEWLVNGRKVKVFCNPPNKLLGKFIAKAYEQFKRHKIQIMMIVPLNVQSSKSWWNNVQLPMERGEKIFTRPIFRRIRFRHNGKKHNGSSINGSCVVIFGRKKKCH